MEDVFVRLSNKLFGWIVDKNYINFEKIKEDIIKSDLKILYKSYVSQMLMATFIVYLMALITSLSVVALLNLPSYISIIYVITIPSMVALSSFAVIYSYPSLNVRKRSIEIERNLPFAINHMSAVISSGIPPTALFEMLRSFEEYGEVSKEANRIVKRIKILGEDVITALKEVSRTTPSDRFRDILYGIISTLETGGDLKKYLQEKAKESLFDYKLFRKKFHEKLMLYSTIYLSLVMAAPLFIILILSVLSFMGGAFITSDILSLMKISIYLLLPLMNLAFIGFLYLIHKEV